MQPQASIQPYHEQTLPNLVGLECRVPKERNPLRCWRCTIKAVRFITEKSAAVWVVARSNVAFQGGKWVDLSTIKWTKQIEDPFVSAIYKAREKV